MEPTEPTPTPLEPKPIGRPFTGEPKRSPAGCSKPVFVGCGIVLVLIGLAAIAFVVKAKDLLGWTMREIRQQVVAALPDDVTAAERARIDRGFDAAIAKIQKGEIETPALYALQSQMMNAAEKAQKKQLTRDDVLDLLSALERVGGLLPKDDEEPAPGSDAPAAPPPATAPASDSA